MDNGRAIPNGNVIVVDDLIKQFGDVTAVNGLSQNVRKGEMYVTDSLSVIFIPVASPIQSSGRTC